MCGYKKKKKDRDRNIMYLLLCKKKKKFSPSNRLLQSCYYGSSAPEYASLVQFVLSPVNPPPKNLTF